MKAIIFGGNGQDGYYLSQHLRSEGVTVISIGRNDPAQTVSLADYASVAQLIKDTQPEFIFHLAANSTTRHTALFENHHTIATGTLHILEAVKVHSPATRVFISGSGLQFVNNGHPIKETDPFEARDGYAVSRIQSVYAARYFRSLGLKVYVGYFFNHDSPLRSERHMSKKITAAVQRIAAGSEEQLVIGDITVKKEWGFAGDIVKGAWTLVNQDSVYEAVIGTGKGYSIEEWLECCFTYKGLNWKDHVTTEPGFMAEYRQLVSEPATIFSLGWQPETSFESLAKMMMD